MQFYLSVFFKKVKVFYCIRLFILLFLHWLYYFKLPKWSLVYQLWFNKKTNLINSYIFDNLM